VEDQAAGRAEGFVGQTRGASKGPISKESIRRSGERLARTGRANGMDWPAEVYPPRRRKWSLIVL